MLEAAGLEPLLEARVDGIEIAERKLRGKPAPDTFLAGAEALACRDDGRAVFEDALSGVEPPARAGSFGYVVGVDRAHQAEALLQHGRGRRGRGPGRASRTRCR